MRLFRSTLPSITPREAADRLQRGELQLVDVREPAEVAARGVPGSTHVPLGHLPSALPELDRDRPVAFLCRSGSRSATATRAALAAGVEAVNVSGGIIAWSRHGLPLR